MNSPTRKSASTAAGAPARASRRNFLKQSAGAAGGLVLGFHLPLMGQQALAQGAAAATMPPMRASDFGGFGGSLILGFHG